MPRPKTHKYVLTQEMISAINSVDIEVTCPKCGETGLLRTHMGKYLVIRHFNTVHTVPPEFMNEVLDEAKKQIEEKINGLKAVLDLIEKLKNQ
jgi:predicted RNA-binding Zn-ribbon protein involved in translation (DUF1610 family)